MFDSLWRGVKRTFLESITYGVANEVYTVVLRQTQSPEIAEIARTAVTNALGRVKP